MGWVAGLGVAEVPVEVRVVRRPGRQQHLAAPLVEVVRPVTDPRQEAIRRPLQAARPRKARRAGIDNGVPFDGALYMMVHHLMVRYI